MKTRNSYYCILFGCSVLLSAQMVGGPLLAQPVGVSYTVSGSSGSYNLDFTIQNSLPADEGFGLYWFGVKLSGQDITGSPAFWPPFFLGSYNPTLDGGPNITYNNVWFDTSPGFGSSQGFLASGGSLSGFDVHVTDPTEPTSVSWFAYAYPDSTTGTFDYTGGQSFNPTETYNPGFVGVVQGGSSSVPDGGFAFSLFSLGLTALGAMGRKFARA